MVIHIGVIGCGSIATRAHLPSLMRLPGVRVVSVMDPVEERAKQVSHTFGIERYHTSLDDMLQDSSIEAFDICSPPKEHAEQILRISEISKPILCEKPIATNMDEANRVKAAVEKTNILFMTGFTYRFHPLIQITREQFQEPHLMRINYSFKPDVPSTHWIADLKNGGGFLVEQAVHWFDLMGWWAGKPHTIYATTDSTKTFDAVVVALSYPHDVLGVVTYNSRGVRHFFHLTMENEEKTAEFRTHLFPSAWGGSLRLDSRTEGHHNFTLGGWRVHQSRKNPIFPVVSALARVQDAHLLPFANELIHFIHCLKHDVQPLVGITEGYEALETAFRAIQSINTGKAISA